jgi:bifunctional DNA-binding transcriptional regulator/antitoxin component of YhaV-PrlF toxin-antitoxin module
MKWIMKLQKLGRIQIPSKWLAANELKVGDLVLIEESGEHKLVITFKVDKKGKKK